MYIYSLLGVLEEWLSTYVAFGSKLLYQEIRFLCSIIRGRNYIVTTLKNHYQQIRLHVLVRLCMRMKLKHCLDPVSNGSKQNRNMFCYSENIQRFVLLVLEN
jgi:hypothetical protein